jgi:hypothetical protein
MSPQQNCDSEMTEAEAIRAVWPRNTMKLLARAMGWPLDTARHNLYRKFSSARRRELARILLDEMDREDVPRTARRRLLAEWAADQREGETDEMAAGLGGVPDRPDLAPPRAETRGEEAMTPLS